MSQAQRERLFPVHEYRMMWTALDEDGNPVAEGPVTLHTDEHHEHDHKGAHTQSWRDHVHAIAQHPIKAAMDAAGVYNVVSLVYRNFQYNKKEWQPYARKAFGIVCNVLKRAVRR